MSILNRIFGIDLFKNSCCYYGRKVKNYYKVYLFINDVIFLFPPWQVPTINMEKPDLDNVEPNKVRMQLVATHS